MADEGNSISSKIDYGLLLPQCLVGLIDAISFMVVTPSLVFYVRAMGGSKEQYGAILSIFSFASFFFKPVLGYWCDKSECKFRRPYLFSIIVASIGGLIYFLASAFTGSVAIYLILLGRFLGGVGAANSTLAFTYIAKVIPDGHMTKAMALLSMVRIFGMAVAPALNIFLSKVSGSLLFIEITPFNSIGLVLFVSNVLSFVVMYILLREPSADAKPEMGSVVDDHDKRSRKFWMSLLSLEIFVPIASILSLNANFQLMETGLAPASSHALGWSPVEVSTVFGINAIFMFVVILLSFQLSSVGVSDGVLLIVGLVTSITGYLLIYLWWSANSGMILFLAPIFLSTAAFPFMGAPTRSIFTRIVAADQYLRRYQGAMQAALSMSASVAGFVAPGLIAAFVLRTPEQVDASQDHRELTLYALFAPISSVIVLIGVLYLRLTIMPVAVELDDESLSTGETSSLLSSHDLFILSTFHPRTESHCRHSVSLMGIPQISFHSSTPNKGRHSIMF